MGPKDKQKPLSVTPEELDRRLENAQFDPIPPRDEKAKPPTDGVLYDERLYDDAHLDLTDED